MYNQLLLSLKIGDGCYHTQTKLSEDKHYSLLLNSINLQYVLHKKNELEKLGIKTSKVHKGKSGYKKSSVIYSISTRLHPLLTQIGNMTNIEVINNLNKEGLIYYYLDDGSYHKTRHHMHLYCNTFNQEELECLINKIYEQYPIKPCTIHYDKKKDGRCYPYLYVPRKVVDVFKDDVYDFLIENDGSLEELKEKTELILRQL